MQSRTNREGGCARHVCSSAAPFALVTGASTLCKRDACWLSASHFRDVSAILTTVLMLSRTSNPRWRSKNTRSTRRRSSLTRAAVGAQHQHCIESSQTNECCAQGVFVSGWI